MLQNLKKENKNKMSQNANNFVLKELENQNSKV